mmetsp:Transcript_60762/g.144714  ORF Transcript_60762/g.144714 Transcript_60762/m.144714 type:complete len:1223 (+) Transcript_60762:87-3755(+)
MAANGCLLSRGFAAAQDEKDWLRDVFEPRILHHIDAAMERVLAKQEELFRQNMLLLQHEDNNNNNKDDDNNRSRASTPPLMPSEEPPFGPAPRKVADQLAETSQGMSAQLPSAGEPAGYDATTTSSQILLRAVQESQEPTGSKSTAGGQVDGDLVLVSKDIASGSKDPPTNSRGREYKATGTSSLHQLMRGSSDYREVVKRRIKNAKRSRQVHGWMQKLGERVLNSILYTFIMVAFIVFDAVLAGWGVKHRVEEGEYPLVHQELQLLCTCVFVVDICLHLLCQGIRFFIGPTRGWNALDVVTILGSIVELVPEVNLETFSTLRILRLLKILHLLKSFHFVFELRVFVHTLGSMAKILFSMLTFLSFELYVLGVGYTHLCVKTCRHEDSLRLCEYFGSLERSITTLMSCMSGGLPWGTVYTSLGSLSTRSAASGRVLLIIFLTSTVYGLLGIVLAFVLEKQAAVSRDDESHRIKREMMRRNRLIDDLHYAFDKLDINESQSITLDELKVAMESEEISALIDSLGISLQDACDTFNLLDVDGTGFVDVEEFILGFMRLQGDASAKDTTRLHSQMDGVWQKVKTVETLTRSINDRLQSHAIGEQSKPSKAIGSYPPAGRPSISRGSEFERQGTMYDEPRLLSNYGNIPRVEQRAMTLLELRGVMGLIIAKCSGWNSASSGKKLKPQEVNLYDLTFNFICPATLVGGMRLDGLPHQKYEPGMRIFQKKGDMLIGEGVVAEAVTGSCVRITVERGSFFSEASAQHEGLATFIGGVALAGGNPSSVECGRNLSYKELVSNDPTDPVWFVSHWWGEPVHDFVACCSLHTKMRPDVRGNQSGYWICGYANRQHDLQQDMSNDPVSSSFYKALQLSYGTLLILDKKATPFSRIWCCFELYCTITEGKPLDIAAVSETTRRAQLLSEGTCAMESNQKKVLREMDFPLVLIIKGMKAVLEQGQASMDMDKIFILKHMLKVKLDATSLDDPQLQAAMVQGAPMLQQANSRLHARLAIAAWPQAVKRRIVQDFDVGKFGTKPLPQLLQADTLMEVLKFSFAHQQEMGDRQLAQLARGLPKQLTELSLSLESCKGIGDEGLEQLATNLPPSLRSLHLDCLGCVHITDTSLRRLVEKLPSQLEKLHVHFDKCSLLSAEGVQYFADGALAKVPDVSGTFWSTPANRDVSSNNRAGNLLGDLGSQLQAGLGLGGAALPSGLLASSGAGLSSLQSSFLGR